VSEADEPPPQHRTELHPLPLIAWIAVAVGVYWFGRYRQELLLVLIVAVALTLLSNVIYTFYARLLRVPAEEFGVGVGGVLVGFHVGRTQVRVNWLPMGGYVKFTGQDPLKEKSPFTPMPGEQRYDQVHPLARVPFVLSAPLATVLLGLALLSAAGELRLLNDLKEWLTNPPRVGPISLARRVAEAWLRQFSGPGGTIRGAGITAICVGVFNLLPVPFCSGGLALVAVVEWLTSPRFARKWFDRASVPFMLALLLVWVGLMIGVALTVFGGT
jgi:hypothetical protein